MATTKLPPRSTSRPLCLSDKIFGAAHFKVRVRIGIGFFEIRFLDEPSAVRILLQLTAEDMQMA